MPRSFSFEEHVIATARAKVVAAQARARPDIAAEKPRDVVLAACAAIGAQLECEGFVFLPSGPHRKRVVGDLTFEIRFQSDRNNAAGRRAAVWIHAMVGSRALAKWRASRPVPWQSRGGRKLPWFAGGQIGNLQIPHEWMEWDFAERALRRDQIDDAVATIRSIMLPFFALFENISTTIDAVLQRPLIGVAPVLEYVAATQGQGAAEAAGRAYLDGNPNLRREYDSALVKFEADGLPRFLTFSPALSLAAHAIADRLHFGG